jgi:hypothetical protein
MKKIIILALIFIPCLSFANYTDNTGTLTDKLPELNLIYTQISNKFRGGCPSSITIKESNVSGISQFDTKSSAILMSKNNLAPKSIAHETVHLCLHKLSNGASNTSQYRFIDEGYATFYGDSIAIGEKTLRKNTMSKVKSFYNQNLISFKQVMDWPKYFGRMGKGGLLGWDAYYVGVSFCLYIKDTYGEEKFFNLLEELGTSLTFNRALTSAIGKTEEQIEEEWINYIKTYDIAGGVQSQSGKTEASIITDAKEIARDGRFIAYDNGTVLDTKTSLMWASKDNESDLNWADGNSYCSNYRAGGYTDWRMPTHNELAGLYDIGKRYKATQRSYNVFLTKLIQLSTCCPWALKTQDSTASHFSLSSGQERSDSQTGADFGRTLPVRSIK